MRDLNICEFELDWEDTGHEEMNKLYAEVEQKRSISNVKQTQDKHHEN